MEREEHFYPPITPISLIIINANTQHCSLAYVSKLRRTSPTDQDFTRFISARPQGRSCLTTWASRQTLECGSHAAAFAPGALLPESLMILLIHFDLRHAEARLLQLQSGSMAAALQSCMPSVEVMQQDRSSSALEAPQCCNSSYYAILQVTVRNFKWFLLQPIEKCNVL
jgi:hypothetical protein